MSGYSMDRFSNIKNKVSEVAKNTASKSSNIASGVVDKTQNLASSVVDKTSNLTDRAGSKISNLGSKSLNTVKKIPDKIRTLNGGSTFIQIIKIFLIAGLLYIVLFLIGKGIKKMYTDKLSNPYIIKDSKNCKNSLTIVQDPSQDGSITLYRSDNKNGAQFTYSVWFLIDNMQYNFGKWKHMFHKGNKSTYPNRAPGVWIHPDTNALRVYMNTFDDILDHVDIHNIPIKKWVSLVITLDNNYMDVYINGFLKKRKELTSLPRQNYGNLWINLFGGFDGYMSKFRYFNYTLSYKEINKIVKQGPSKSTCGDTGEVPPYLDDSWWFSM